MEIIEPGFVVTHAGRRCKQPDAPLHITNETGHVCLTREQAIRIAELVIEDFTPGLKRIILNRIEPKEQ